MATPSVAIGKSKESTIIVPSCLPLTNSIQAAPVHKNKPRTTFLTLPAELRHDILLKTYGQTTLGPWSLNREDKKINKWAESMKKVEQIKVDVEYAAKSMRRNLYRIWLRYPQVHDDWFRSKEWDEKILVQLIERELEGLRL